MSTPLVIGTASAFSLLGMCMLGAVYFGLASCGGLAWHKDAFHMAATALYVLALALPSSVLPSWKAKLSFAIVLPAGYVLLESAVAPFYPAAPSSLGEYFALLFQAAEFGPCD